MTSHQETHETRLLMLCRLTLMLHLCFSLKQETSQTTYDHFEQVQQLTRLTKLDKIRLCTSCRPSKDCHQKRHRHFNYQ